MVDAPSRWRGLGTAPTEDLAPTEEQNQTLDPIRRQDLFHERQKAKDHKPPRVRAFIARGRGVYANMWIKMPSEAGPRHPLGQPLVGQKGGVSLF